jgi:tetratricopeptide (TPR) repeat protein
MRAALAWALENEERELGLELCVALENYWVTNAQAEGIDWNTALLGDGSGIPERLVARALRVQGGMIHPFGRHDEAEQLWEDALAIARRLGDTKHVAVLLHRLSHIAIAQRDFARVRALAEESLAGHREVRFPRGEAQALSSLAVAARAEGDLEGALELLHESRRIADEIGFRWWLSGTLANIGDVSLALGRLDDARTSARQALRHSAAMSDRRAVVYELSLLALISAEAGDSELAGRLWGAAEAEIERAPVGRWPHGAVEPDRILAYVNPELEQGRAAGRELSFEDAISLALAESQT